jgi:DNA repair protein RadD
MKAQNISFGMMQQFVALGADRYSWMFFAQGVVEAEEACDMLNNHFGIPTVVMHSKRTAKQNDEALADWQLGRARCAVNMGMLTTGIDHPALDFIGAGRATMSTALWVQIMSRGTRPYSCFTERNPVIAAAFPYVKKDCLVADFAGNTNRLGPIDNPKVPRKRGEGGGGDAPVRICPQAEGGCSCYNNASARVCVFCGYEFKFASKVEDFASTAELMSTEQWVYEMHKVDRVIYSPHFGKLSKKSSVKVSYYCGLRTFYEWITVEGIGGRVSGRDWFRQRHPSEPPATNAEVLHLMGELRSPKEIRVWMNANPNPRVIAAEF